MNASTSTGINTNRSVRATIRKAAFAQIKAELLRTLRNKRFVMFSVIMPIAFYFIFTSTMDADAEVGGVDWSAYYLMSMTAYGVAGAGITSLSQKLAKERTQGWTQLLRITPLPSWAFIVSKVASQALINLCTVVLMFLVAAFAKGVDLSAAVWIESGLWIWLGSFAFMALGSLVGTIRNTDVVQVVSMIVYMGMSVLGGLWMPVETMSSTMRTIAHVLPTYWLGHGAWNLLGDGTFDWLGVVVLAVYIVAFTLISSLIIRKQEAV
ncbi:ABC transporter permease [Paenibacillus sp. MMS18-CY102]|uniref:ABC transporter permease n=1 Tax=Paenibacillus sp. MMS18-CY102 TaxID=2682849 RepID=UPI0013665D0A|nr:ABC transporter permease [Paenibacillus sp. MMS18-CY102]MWC28419.1 ABC transporter permease [Paenibacillus sp. MMS18-CY102]